MAVFRLEGSWWCGCCCRSHGFCDAAFGRRSFLPIAVATAFTTTTFLLLAFAMIPAAVDDDDVIVAQSVFVLGFAAWIC